MIAFSSKRVTFVLVLLLLPLLYFYPVAQGNLVLAQGDGWTANLGLRILTGRMIAQWALPLWNPYIFAGMPLMASIYPGALYPPNWLFALAPAGVAMNAVVITTYHISLIGAYLYARSLQINRTGSLVAGLVFSFGGYMVMSMGQTSNIASAAWAPWILLAIEKSHQRVSWRWVAVGACFIALQFFAGVPQMSWHTALVGGAYFLFRALSRTQERWRFVAAVLAMVVCGALLSAVQFLPLRELQLQSGRAEISYEYFAGFSFPPRQLPALVFPYFFGGATMSPYRAPYWGRDGIFVTCGYVGMLGLSLSFVALIGARARSIIRFWAGVAVISLLLSFGDYLPFGINHWLYRVPVYNLFRASHRHMFEFTLACGALAGYGVSALSRSDAKETKRALRLGVFALAVLVVSTLVAYLFFGEHLAAGKLSPARDRSLFDPEALIPLFFFAVSVAALWNYARRPAPMASGLLLLTLFVDLAAYGHALEWRAYQFSVAERLADPPPVKYIKARETDLNSFRILSHATAPFGENYDLLDYPNNSIARGLQSANGYDMLRLRRPAAVMSEMTPEGFLQNFNSFGVSDQGFNLFNIKYLLIERGGPPDPGAIVYGGVRFRDKPLDLNFGPGVKWELAPGGVTATELAIVSTMGNSTHIADGEPALRVSLIAEDGRMIERELQAGRDTSEWAYDRADVRATIKHARAPVVESWPVSDEAGGFQGHRYLARLKFERAVIEKIALTYLRKDAGLQIMRASLHDSVSGASTTLDAGQMPPERWRKLASFGAVDLYQNLKAMPRAWFVKRVVAAPSAEVLSAIREGRDSEGRVFDPAETALLEKEDFGAGATAPELPPVATNAEAMITRYEPQRIELTTHNSESGFLVLSEIYYPGWEARVDGAPTPIFRANYALRGIVIPPGERKVEFVFTSPSFRAGAICSGVAVSLLLAGACYARWRPFT